MSKAAARLEAFEQLLSAGTINLRELFKLSHGGIPDRAPIRAVAWKLLLKYLPPDRAQWEAVLSKKRALYATFLTEFILDTQSMDSDGAVAAGEFSDPLGATSASTAKADGGSSKWDLFFKENETLAQIHKDVLRLCPEFAFFQGSTDRPRPLHLQPLHARVGHEPLATETMVASRSGVPELRRSSSNSGSGAAAAVTPQAAERHWEVIERILFIFAKLNPGIGYIQGMNEIIGVLYYTLAIDPTDGMHAEADSFFCFTSLLSDGFRDLFVKTLDASDMGIGALMQRVLATLRVHDEKVHARLEQQGIQPQFFAFRWLTLLLAQEFPLPDVVRLWDSLFSKQDRLEYLVCLCIAMVVNLRDSILTNDFADNVKLLQKYPPVDTSDILRLADKALEQEEHSRRHREYLRNGKMR